MINFNQAQQTNDQVGADEQARLRKYRDAWQAYYGKHKKPLLVKKGKPDDNIIVNYTRLVVDVGIAFLFGEPDDSQLKEIHFSTDGGDGGQTNAPETWLRGCWKANRKMTTLQKVGLNGAVCGNSYVKVMLPKPGQPYPRIVALDPAIVTPAWEDDDIDQVWKWVIEYHTMSVEGKPIKKRQVVEQDGGRWVITDLEADANAKNWQQTGETVWPFLWSPIHHCQNLPDPNVFWGISDLESDVIALNNATNFILSNINRIIRYHAHPKTWGKGFNTSQLKIGADETIVLEAPDAELHNLEMLSDLTSSTAFYKAIRQALRETTHVPEVALGGIEDASRVSSLALKVLYGPLLMHTGRKRATYGEMLGELNSHLLEIGGFGQGVEVSNIWPYVLPEDPMQEANTLLIDQQLGASKETTLRKRGYNPGQEAAKRQNEGGTLGEQLLAAFDRGNPGV